MGDNSKSNDDDPAGKMSMCEAWGLGLLPGPEAGVVSIERPAEKVRPNEDGGCGQGMVPPKPGE